MGNTAESRQAYEQFFEGWKKPTRICPLLMDAKKEIDGLR
jgi:hypothetical protein